MPTPPPPPPVPPCAPPTKSHFAPPTGKVLFPENYTNKPAKINK